MQHTRLQAIAQAVCKRQERYQRNTLLFDQLVRLLVQGRPVAPELLAHRLHWELEEVRSILQAHPELEYDEQGNLVGSGLTLVPTAHQLQVEQRTLFAWCAFDTLTYPVELHLSVQVTSRCPVTGRSIRLTVTPEQVLDLDPGDAAPRRDINDERDPSLPPGQTQHLVRRDRAPNASPGDRTARGALKREAQLHR